MATLGPRVKWGLDRATLGPYRYVTMGTERKKRRKTQAERKEDVIKVTVTSEQKRVITEAAKAAGLDVSGWLRSLALASVKESGGGEG